MFKTKKLTSRNEIKKSPVWAIIFSLILIVGISRLLVFLESNIGSASWAEAAPLSDNVEVNQMTHIIEDGYLK